MSSRTSWLVLKCSLALFVVVIGCAVPAVQAAAQDIAVVGDSLSSGHGLAHGKSWVALLRQHLQAQGYGGEVVNASITGDTSAGGLARLPRVLRKHAPDIVVIELGGNDGLRGQPVDALRQNLAAMIKLAKDANARVLLLGVRIPPNYGSAYTQAFAAVYPALAKRFHVPLVAFMLKGVALQPELMQSDGIHPNARGQKIVFDNIWPTLKAML